MRDSLDAEAGTNADDDSIVHRRTEGANKR